MNHLTSQKTPSLHKETSKQGKIVSGQEDHKNNIDRVPDFLPLGDLTISGKEERLFCMIPESFEKVHGNSDRTLSSLREIQSYNSLFSTNANTSHHYDNDSGTSSRSTTTTPPPSNVSPRSVHMMIPRRSHCISDSMPYMPVL